MLAAIIFVLTIVIGFVVGAIFHFAHQNKRTSRIAGIVAASLILFVAYLVYEQQQPSGLLFQEAKPERILVGFGAAPFNLGGAMLTSILNGIPTAPILTAPDPLTNADSSPVKLYVREGRLQADVVL